MCLVPTRYHFQQKRSLKDFIYEPGFPLRGFIIHRDMERLDTIVISNPVTGESISLPKVELKGLTMITPYLGYNPINKQSKILCIKYNFNPNTCDEHQVLTLENGNHLWRTTQCEPYIPKSDGICIDGILYYTARLDSVFMIVCFDVRSEKFSFIELDELRACCTLINYKGKLGVLQLKFAFPKRLEFWVLEDAERCVWSKKSYTLPPLLDKTVNQMDKVIVGMTSRGEVLISTLCLKDPFYIYYFNLESNHVTRVQIQGFEVFENMRVFITLDNAENLKVM